MKPFIACIGGALVDVVVECTEIVQVGLINAILGYVIWLIAEFASDGDHNAYPPSQH